MKYQINLDAVLPNNVKSAVKSGMLFAKIKIFPFPEDEILPSEQGIAGEQVLNGTNNIQCFDFEVTESGDYKCYTSTSQNGTYTERKSFGGSAGKQIQVIENNVPISLFREVEDAEFYSLITANDGDGDLSVGANYKIIDWRTIYDQPDYASNGTPKEVVETKTGAVHPLIVTAIAKNQISPIAFQPDFPKDRILYDWTFRETEVMGEPAMGRIYERIDEWGNRTDYDHREVLFKRYESEAASGIFNSFKDNGEAVEEFLTFPMPGDFELGNSIGNWIGNFSPAYNGEPFVLANNVFGEQAQYNFSEGDLYKATLGTGSYNNKFGFSVYGLLAGNGFYLNQFLKGASPMIFGDNVNNTIIDASISNLDNPDFSSSTLLSGINPRISKTIIRNSAGILKVSYIDGDGVLQVAAITD